MLQAPTALRCPTLQDVAESVCSYFGVTLDDLRGPSQKLSLTYPRKVFMHVARERTRYSLDEVGSYVSRTGSGVYWSMRRLERELASEEVRYDVDTVRSLLRDRMAA